MNYFREVVLRQPYGLQTDLWAIGCIVYSLLTGAPPFEVCFFFLDFFLFSIR